MNQLQVLNRNEVENRTSRIAASGDVQCKFFFMFQICETVLDIFTVCQLCQKHHRLLRVQTTMPAVCTFQLRVLPRHSWALWRPSSAQRCPDGRHWGLHKYAFPCIRIAHTHVSVVFSLWAADPWGGWLRGDYSSGCVKYTSYIVSVSWVFNTGFQSFVPVNWFVLISEFVTSPCRLF